MLLRSIFVALALAVALSMATAVAQAAPAETGPAYGPRLEGFEYPAPVKLFKFENPHVNIVVTVRDEKSGTTTDWFIEAASVRGMAMAGWRRSTLKAGDGITVIGRPLRDGQPGASLVRAVLADGTTLAANGGRNY